MNGWDLIIGFCFTKGLRVAGIDLEAKKVQCQANPNQQRRRRFESMFSGGDQDAQGN